MYHILVCRGELLWLNRMVTLKLKIRIFLNRVVVQGETVCVDARLRMHDHVVESEEHRRNSMGFIAVDLDVLIGDRANRRRLYRHFFGWAGSQRAKVLGGRGSRRAR